MARRKKDPVVSDSMTLLQCQALLEKMQADMQALSDHDVEFAKISVLQRELSHLVESVRGLVTRDVG